MNDKLFDFNNPYTAFIVVAAAITITILLLRLIFDYCVLLWKSTLISYIVYFAFAIFIYVGNIRDATPFEITVFKILGPLLLFPGLLIYGLIPGIIKPCSSDTDILGWLTCGFLFYTIVIWGIMKLVKKSKEPVASEKKQDDNIEKQTPTETDA
jgi:hypothetical protein